MPKFPFSFILSLMFTVLFGGCAHYRCGSPIQNTAFKTLYIAPVKNQAFVAQSQSVLSGQLRTLLLRKNFLKLTDKEHADLILETTIQHYGRSIGAIYENDPDNAKTLSLNITVSCDLFDQNGNYYLKDCSVSHSISVTANDIIQNIENQRLPQLTREISNKIISLIENVEPKQP